MQVNPNSIKNHFKKTMDKYNLNAVVQKKLAKKLADKLVEFNSSYETIVELGCGTGFLTQEIADNINFKNYFANDLIDKSKKYIDKILPSCTFICGNAQKVKPSKKADLIVSSAMFQWFKDLEKAGIHYSSLLNKNGILAFTTFSPENFKEIRNVTGLSLEYKSLEQIKSELQKNFEILYTEEYTEIINFKTPLELLAHMKNTGVNSLSEKHWSFKEVKDFCDDYKQKYPDVNLTYAPIIVICKKRT